MTTPDRPLLLPRPGRYEHYAGTRYDVLGTAEHAQVPGVLLVIYRPAQSAATRLYALPVRDFMETVVVAGKRVPCFLRIDVPDEAEEGWEP